MAFRWTPGTPLTADNLNKMNPATEAAIAQNAHNIAELYAQMYLDGKAPDSLGLFFDTFSDESKRDPASTVFFSPDDKQINMLGTPYNFPINPQHNKTKTIWAIGLYGGTVSDDGTNLYYIQGQNPYIKQYAMSTAWDISTLYDTGKSYYVYFGSDMHITPDGTKVTFMKYTAEVYQRTLTTPFDISSMQSSNDFYQDLSGNNTNAITFTDDGTKFFLALSDGRILQYDLAGAPYDLNNKNYTASYSALTSDEISKIKFNKDGTKFFIGTTENSTANPKVYEYNLSTPYNLGTATLIATHTLGGSYWYGQVMHISPYHTIAMNDSADVGTNRQRTFYDYFTGGTDTALLYKNNKITFQQDLRTARLWITRNSTAKYNISTASGSTITISGDKTTQLATGDTIDIFTADNINRERKKITAIDYNTTNAGQTTITLDSAISGTYTTSDYVERVDVLPEISLVDKDGAENFQVMEYVRSTVRGNETEEEYKLTVSGPGHDLVVKLNLTRNDTSLQPYAKMLAVSLTP